MHIRKVLHQQWDYCTVPWMRQGTGGCAASAQIRMSLRTQSSRWIILQRARAGLFLRELSGQETGTAWRTVILYWEAISVDLDAPGDGDTETVTARWDKHVSSQGSPVFVAMLMNRGQAVHAREISLGVRKYQQTSLRNWYTKRSEGGHRHIYVCWIVMVASPTLIQTKLQLQIV